MFTSNLARNRIGTVVLFSAREVKNNNVRINICQVNNRARRCLSSGEDCRQMESCIRMHKTYRQSSSSISLLNPGRARLTMGSGIQTLNLAGAPEIEKEPITSAIPRSVKWTRCQASTDSLYMITLLADADSVLRVTTFSTEVGTSFVFGLYKNSVLGTYNKGHNKYSPV